MPPPRPIPEAPRVNPFKRLERYVSAFFKLGRLARMTKAAAHSVAVIEPRVDALTHDLYDVSDRQGQLEAEIRGAMVDEVDGRFDEAESQLETAISALHSLENRVGKMEGEADLHRIRYKAIRAERDSLNAQLSAMDDRLAVLDAALTGMRDRLGGTEVVHFEAMAREVADMRWQMDRSRADAALASRAYTELSRRLDLQRFRHGEAAADVAPESPPAREGLEALLEAFYNRLEDRYRGAREEIRGRLTVYLPDVTAALKATGGLPALDLGCGRGEWLELLASRGVTARGVDLNPVQIAEAEAAGLDVAQADALKTLAEVPDNALSVITAHHLIEHLPFESVTWMSREALRALAPGGVLIYETPNCHNLIVGARTFHIDPTHRAPLPSELISALLDTVGFHPVEMRPLHPSGTLEAFQQDNRADPYIAELLFGPQDLAAIAMKPGTS